jgi:hypothetical protein
MPEQLHNYSLFLSYSVMYKSNELYTLCVYSVDITLSSTGVALPLIAPIV